jgi:release factor glutamine methyltransferase
MTINDALIEGFSILFYAEVATPNLDNTILLSDALGMTKERLYANLSDQVGDDAYRRYRESLDKRCSGNPVSYIIGRKEFYGIEFYVDERVLVPRPDTETLVETTAGLIGIRQDNCKVIDVCTGSGCVALTLKTMMPSLDICASDISARALEVFRINSRRILGYEMQSYESDLFDGIAESFDIIVSNPPYLADKEVGDMKKTGWPEPSLALRGGASGRDVTEKLISRAKEKLLKGGWLILESAPGYMDALQGFMKSKGYAGIFVGKDLGSFDRVIAGKMC